MSPHDIIGQHILERLSKYPLLHALVSVRIAAHLCRGICPHRDIYKFLVQEGHAPFYAPCRQSLVRPQAVVQMELGELAHGFLVKFLGVRSLVKVQIPAEELIGALTGEHHLDAHAPDEACQQEHWRGCAYGRDVVGFEMIDDIVQRIQRLLYSEMHLVMYCTQILGGLSGCGQIRRVL